MNPQYPGYNQPQWGPPNNPNYPPQQPYGQQQPYYPQQQQYYGQPPPPNYSGQQQYYPQQPPSQPQYYPQQPPSQPQYYPQQAQPGYYPQGWNQYYVFNPNTFTDTYNPWSANMWLQNCNVPPAGQPPQPMPPQQQQIPQGNYQPPPNNEEIFKFESVEQFQKLRHHATVESAISQLSELATDLSTIDPNTFYPDQSSCFICCNSYTKPQYQLGVGPINDAITVAANHKFMGYIVYYLHNPHHTLFLNFLRVFLQKVTRYLTLFYTGHGAQMKDKTGDELDGYDEVVVFDSGYVVDDELADYLKKYCNGNAHTILLSDCCHSGTIWDIPETLSEAASFPPNILSISASSDNQTAKQKSIGKNNQGIFTFNFWTVVRNNPGIKIGDAQNILNPELKKFNQQLEMFPTREDMLYKPIFPLQVKG